MKRKDDDNPWGERVAAAALTLAAIAAYKHRQPILTQIKKAAGKLPNIIDAARTQSIDNFGLLVVRTTDPKEAEIVFRGFRDPGTPSAENPQEIIGGSERFQVRPSDLYFLISSKRTLILAGEVITGSKIPGFSAVHTFEVETDEASVLKQRYAVRLTPRRFERSPN